MFRLLFALLFSSPVLASEKLLDAIAEVESGNNPAAVGKFGERGAYQFRWSAWTGRTKLPFDLAFDPVVSRRVARLHLAWLRERLIIAGVSDSDFNLAMAWNCGLSPVIYGRIPPQAWVYAERVEAMTRARK